MVRILKILVAAALPLAGLAYYALYVGGSGETERVALILPSGISAARTGELLAQNGVIRSGTLFHLAAKFTGSDRRLKPGSYAFRRAMAIMEAMEIVKGGSNNHVKVVIPEGFSARQIAERLQAEGVCRSDEFLRHVQGKRLEGYLFPATYPFEPGSSVETVVGRMRQEFKRQVEPEYERSGPKPFLTLHQVVTLASIVEREAVLPAERPLIAAVYLNRLRIRMRLEADPTVQYALGYWKKGLTRADLENPSPYNTYNHYGLPPGPICSPSLGSVLGVLKPARTEAIYFVADARGGHRFSITLEEHVRAKQAFKRELRLQEELRRKK